MCTLAGCVGNGRAAPILLDMIRREEVLWSEGRLQRRSLAIYATVERLVAAGLVKAENEDVPGVLDGETAPRTVFSLQHGGTLS